MRQLIRWYRQSPPCFRVVFRSGPSASAELLENGPPPRDGRKRILVVCFGNVCRSPFAAAMLHRRLDGNRWQVLSAGTNAAEGNPTSEHMRVASREHGIDLSQHRSRRVTPEVLRTSDIIIAMSQHQIDKLVAVEPTIKRRIRLLGGFDPRPNTWGLPADPRRSAARSTEVPDPTGEDFEFHRECCRRLDGAVTQLSRWLERRNARRPLPKPRMPLSAPTLRAARMR